MRNPAYAMSAHFSSNEFACRCGQCQYGCSYTSGSERIVSPRLVAALEHVRSLYGDKPIYIRSGRRCSAHNRRVGGVENSYHLFGLAADIYGDDMNTLATAIKRSGEFSFVQFNAGYIHVDIGHVRNCKYEVRRNVKYL